MSPNPLVSVFIPAYNAEKYLEKTIRGVVGQSFQDWELIVINNASKDGTEEIIQQLVREFQDSRIRVLTNKTTLPAPENWNVGLRHAKGEFLKMVCADDIPAKNCIERQVKALQDHPEAVLASGSRIIINSKGKPLFKRSGIAKNGIHAGPGVIRRCIMAGANIIGDPVCVMWRRSATEQLGYFDPSVVYCTDMEYWLRLLSIGDLYYDTEPVGFYRIHKNAAARGLAGVAAEDIVHTARLQVERGSIHLNELQLDIVRLNSHIMGLLRQAIYKVLG